MTDNLKENTSGQGESMDGYIALILPNIQEYRDYIRDKNLFIDQKKYILVNNENDIRGRRFDYYIRKYRVKNEYDIIYLLKMYNPNIKEK